MAFTLVRSWSSSSANAIAALSDARSASTNGSSTPPPLSLWLAEWVMWCIPAEKNKNTHINGVGVPACYIPMLRVCNCAFDFSTVSTKTKTPSANDCRALLQCLPKSRNISILSGSASNVNYPVLRIESALSGATRALTSDAPGGGS